MAENEERPIQPSDLSGASTEPPRFIIPINNTTTTKSDLGSYIPSNQAEVLEIVLENVLRFLTSIGDRNAASLVCKSWYRAEGFTRLDVNIGNCYAVSPSRVISRFGRVKSLTIKGFLGWSSSRAECETHFSPWVNPTTEAYRGLEKVYLKGMYVTNDDLCVLAQSFPDLKELVLVRCEGFGTRGLGIVARECRQISVFELIKSVVDVDDDEVDWISCFPESSSCLESFIFDCAHFPVNFEALEQLVTRSPSLKKLTLSSDVSISELHRIIVLAPQLTHLGRGMVGSFSELQDLMVRAPQFFHFRNGADMVDDRVEEDQDIADIAACKSLECLSGFEGDYLQAIVPVCGNNLKTLDVSSIFSTIKAKEILHCHKLQSLKVCDSIRDEGLKAVAATCKDLREFCLNEEEDKGFVSEVGLLAIFEGCRKLQYIKYDGHGMTNAALLAISENCPDLRVLRILVGGRDWANHSRGEPFDIGIGAIVKNCKKMTRLKVRGLLTDRAFQCIGEYGKVLRSLSFIFNKKSDMGLKYVLEGCSKLQKLEIMNCPFEDSHLPHYYYTADLGAGSHHYYNMKSFLRMGYGGVSGAGCGKIAHLLLDRFGLEAHVMLYMFNYSAHRLYKTSYHYSTTHGHMKFFLKR